MSEQQKSMPIPTQVKEWFIAMREGIIVIVVAILLLNPSFIGTIAKEAGLKSAFGMEFIEQLQESQMQTSKAQDAVNMIMEELGQMKTELRQLSTTAGSTNPEIAQEISRITSNVGTLEQRSREIKGSLETSLKTQEAVIRMSRSKLSPAVRESP